MRWPYASYSALSTVAGVMPKRAALARSISTYTDWPPFCRSVATSASDGSCFRRDTSFGTQVANSSLFGLVSMNWYCVGLTVESIVRSCTDCM